MDGHAPQLDLAEEARSLDTAGRRGAWFHGAKRLIDVAGVLIAAVVFSPILMSCALWIRLIDGGPVFYRQWRVGRDGWLFQILKFRTMRQNAEKPGSAQWAGQVDDRVLPGCRWMRRSHIDELPQLWNILIGEMSLVGPRPERPEMIDDLRAQIPAIELRHMAKPGLTGLAQLRNGYTNDVEGARKKLAYDLRYLQQRTIFWEVGLMLQTVPKFWDRAAC